MTRRSDAQAFDGPAIDQMFLDDLVNVFFVHVAVPDCLGVNDDDGALLAAIKTAGLVDAHPALA